jgi:predicted O-methyltransferase YrrM|tara:strand:+ start:38 stop:664 length:627 start_codon:yes stop_codon:yes gene_type:complete
MKQSYFKIPGWFNYSETYDIIVDEIADDGVIVEIGSFLGRSTHYLATSLFNANKFDVKIYCIDTFAGSSEHANLKLPSDFAHIFRDNLKFFIGRDMVIPMQGRSDKQEILDKFENDSVDYIMVDGAHEYEPVMDDITNWYPKLKETGVMFGDDFGLEAVRQATKDALPKVGAEMIAINSSQEQTWMTSKDNNHNMFVKLVPGTNCLKT